MYAKYVGNTLLLVLLWLTPTVDAQQMQLPADVRQWYRNPDGSCVQCSLGMVGVWSNVPQATTLLWDTPYGPAERGGSWPERVSRYAQSRKIHLYNITGTPTLTWMLWAARTGRGCGAALGTGHFQTVYGFDPHTQTWLVCDNNTPQRIDYYTHAEFMRLHRRSGLWAVVLNTVPPPDPPTYFQWWTR